MPPRVVKLEVAAALQSPIGGRDMAAVAGDDTLLAQKIVQNVVDTQNVMTKVVQEIKQEDGNDVEAADVQERLQVKIQFNSIQIS